MHSTVSGSREVAVPSRWSFIATTKSLEEACQVWVDNGVIGLDTEFVRETTYYPRPALIQVAGCQGVSLIDPLEVSDLDSLKAVLMAPAVVKVMHACDEDLEVLELLTGGTVKNVFDTQLAASFTGYGFSLGYQNLVERLLGIVVDKTETRSNWLKRPLSPAQLRYAALDATYLLPMHDRLLREIEAVGRSTWPNEELEHRRRARSGENLLEAVYLRIHGRRKLTSEQRRVLRALCRWRETEATFRDMPRRHLLSDGLLVKLAGVASTDVASLEDIQGLPAGIRTRYGQSLVACIVHARSGRVDQTDTAVNLKPYSDQLDRLKSVVQRIAETNNLPPELLANRRMLEELVVSVVKQEETVPRKFQGWRFELVTRVLLKNICPLG